MRLVLCVFIGAWILSVALFAQQRNADHPQEVGPAQGRTVRQDASALFALRQMAATTGWALARLPQNAVVQGTYTGASTNGTFRLSVSSDATYRMELSFPTGESIVIGTPNGSEVIKPDGSRMRRAGKPTIPPVLPFLSGYIADPPETIQLRDLGSETLKGQECRKLEITPMVPGEQAPQIGRKVLWVSSSNFLPTQIEYVIPSDSNPARGMRAVRQLSDFHIVRGIAIPFHQEEFFDGKLQFTFDLSDVDFATGGQQ